MKKLISISLLAMTLLLINACEKTHFKCSHPIFYVPFGFAFVGFTPEEVDTLILEKYALNSNFLTLVGQDTLNYKANPADTIFNDDRTHFFELKSGFDYRLKVTSINYNVEITEVTGGPAIESWIQKGSCSPGAGQAVFVPYTATVNRPNFFDYYWRYSSTHGRQYIDYLMHP